jgi:glycosyltransferase involved in cell wall biosynthesis
MTARTIVVDALSVHMGGGLSYLGQQLAALRRVDPGRALRVLGTPGNQEALQDAIGRPVERIRLPGIGARLAYEQLVLPFASAPGGVLYCPGNVTPLAPSRLPVVLTLQNPNLFAGGRELAHNRRLRRRLQVGVAQRSARRADRVVVISDALRDQVIEDGVVDKDRLRVVPSGRPDLIAADRAVQPDGFPFAPRTFFLVLANDAPHKRHDDTVRAWGAAFADDTDAPGLVIAGRMSEARRAAHRSLVPAVLRSRLVHLGGVDDRSQVSWLLRSATALVSMAALEAHPLTPAEAGAAGCPLVLSDIAAHREVAGDHAAFVPVGAVEVLAITLQHPPGDRTPWTWPVTWDENAQRLLDVFDEVVP